MTMMISDVEVKYCVSCYITHLVSVQVCDCFRTFILRGSCINSSVYFTLR
jgi:hypothetical protein